MASPRGIFNKSDGSLQFSTEFGTHVFYRKFYINTIAAPSGPGYPASQAYIPVSSTNDRIYAVYCGSVFIKVSTVIQDGIWQDRYFVDAGPGTTLTVYEFGPVRNEVPAAGSGVGIWFKNLYTQAVCFSTAQRPFIVSGRVVGNSGYAGLDATRSYAAVGGSLGGRMSLTFDPNPQIDDGVKPPSYMYSGQYSCIFYGLRINPAGAQTARLTVSEPNVIHYGTGPGQAPAPATDFDMDIGTILLVDVTGL